MICVVMVLHRAARHGGAEQICIMVVACDGEWQHLPCKLCFGHDGSTGGTPIRLEGSSNISAGYHSCSSVLYFTWCKLEPAILQLMNVRTVL